MDKEFWDDYYDEHLAVTYPSPFATFCQETFLPPACSILELGSGSGRDAIYFFEKGHRVVALEQSPAAVSASSERVAGGPNAESIRFVQADFTQLDADTAPAVDAIYSRFTLHSITKSEQDQVLEAVHGLLPRAGLLLIEARTIHDPYYGKGTQVGEHEFVTDHYRRHLDSQEFLVELLGLGFEVRYFHEGTGLARFRGEDPVVLRAVLVKPPYADPPADRPTAG